MQVMEKLKVLWQERASLSSMVRRSSVSFSQYGEDCILNNLLHPGKSGTYVDVGANDPIQGSNTFRLYLRGWSGLAIDPNPTFSRDFKKYRPRDIYLTEGVALEPGELIYHSFDHDVFNTFDPEVVEKLVAEGKKLLSRTPVQCRPLGEIIDQHLNGRHIDVLNVDCEGLDIDVLKSLDLQKRRPTVILVEDYARYFTFQRGTPATTLELLLREHGFLPLAQTAWSGIYLAEDWRDLFRRSNAFDERSVSNGYLPGQVAG